MEKILVVMENNSFIIRNIIEQLQELEYSVVAIEIDNEQILSHKDNYEVIFIYTESDDGKINNELEVVKNIAVEGRIPVFFLGNDVEEIRRIIPEYILIKVFKRPIDVKNTAKEVDEYIKNHSKDDKKKILVVDDSGAMLRNVKGWLGEKYDVILANSGTMAIKYLATDRPDLVLLDYEMPVIDGRQVLEMIRSETEFKNIPVIFLTTKNDKESIIKVMELKPEGYLLKTMEPKQIVQSVDDFFLKRK